MIMLTNRNRSGFALPVVILAMFLLVGALATGFTLLSGERATDDATLQAQSAAALAETGLQQALNNRTGLGLVASPGATPDSARLQVAGGYVDIITARLRAPVDGGAPGLYFIRTRGTRTASGVGGGRAAVATASAFATYRTVNLTVRASMTGLNGIEKNGSSGIISGHDACGQKPSLPAVAVPRDPGIDGNGQWENSLEGSIKADTIGNTPAEAAEQVGIDWDGIVNHNAITPDYDLPASGAGFPTQAWYEANPTRWPVIIVRNGPENPTNFALPNYGRGTLIIFGNFTLSGSHGGWEGIVLVGGHLTSNGANEVNGATITGLNVKLGYTVANNDVNELNGTKKYLYNSCAVANALNASGGAVLRPISATWANNFPTF
jgi:hypothetical protein